MNAFAHRATQHMGRRPSLPHLHARAHVMCGLMLPHSWRAIVAAHSRRAKCRAARPAPRGARSSVRSARDIHQECSYVQGHTADAQGGPGQSAGGLLCTFQIHLTANTHPCCAPGPEITNGISSKTPKIPRYGRRRRDRDSPCICRTCRDAYHSRAYYSPAVHVHHHPNQPGGLAIPPGVANGWAAEAEVPNGASPSQHFQEGEAVMVTGRDLCHLPPTGTGAGPLTDTPSYRLTCLCHARDGMDAS